MNSMQGSLQSGRILSTLYEPLVLAVANPIPLAIGFLCRPHIYHLGLHIVELHYRCTGTFVVVVSGLSKVKGGPRVVDGQDKVK